MRHILTLFMLILSSCSMNNNSDIDNIKKVLYTQQKCWNNGDIDGFMEGYWNSEKLIFTTDKDETTFGWENTLKRYKESYPTKESMGELKFKIIDLELSSKNTATLKGKWKLIREKDQPNGLFWVDLKKFDESWLITKDSTISFEIKKTY